ncbi:cytochrome b561 domain-containing protein At4g18260-like [Chenopodium quinoa]|uniref:cytochrome b561 domain-containing protein At4g18260-like n=1 Tax=Chenopodium quinoa TaxID=63459 RepID=UPI000B7857BE|nr:cytochrome b561 domain-containing protein At4g18260-like [Chenopodium quinoa]
MDSWKSNLTSFALMVLIHLPLACCSSLKEAMPVSSHLEDNSHNQLLSPKMTFEVTLHGLLLWASLGFLMPLGILIIRLSNREESGTRLKLYFYFHLTVQILSLSIATAGAIKSIKTFENSFNNSHQRIGLALYIAIWVQAAIGFCRPHRGTKKRSLWYFFHWIFGTITCIVGILNIYTGLEAYKKRTKRSVTLWTFLFTIEISSMAFFYLFQDKWDYMQKQSVSLREGGQVRPSDDQESSIRDDNDNKNLWREPCSKVNALKNLFN